MEYHLKNAYRISQLLDSKFNILGFRFGLDPLIGLIPGLGDTLTAILSLYLVYIGVRMNLSLSKIMLMIFNIILDYVIGIIPVIGDLTDFVFKSFERNYLILLNEYQRINPPIKSL